MNQYFIILFVFGRILKQIEYTHQQNSILKQPLISPKPRVEQKIFRKLQQHGCYNPISRKYLKTVI